MLKPSQKSSFTVDQGRLITENPFQKIKKSPLNKLARFIQSLKSPSLIFIFTTQRSFFLRSLTKMSLIHKTLLVLAVLAYLTHPQTISFSLEENNNYEAYYRELVKQQNLKLIEAHNQNGDNAFSLKPNRFLAMRNDQFYEMYTSTMKMQSNEDPAVQSIQQIPPPSNSTSPFQTLLTASRSPSLNIDLSPFTTPPKDQGKCNSCYSHSAVATLQSLLYKRYNQSFDLSEQQIVDCTIDWAPKEFEIYNNRGCLGGWGWISYHYLKYCGVTYEKDYPYLSKITGKEMMCRANSLTSRTFRVKDYQHYYNKLNPQAQCSKLNDLLLDGRTVAVSIWVPRGQQFQFYGSATPGIDVWNLCGPYDDVNHQVQLVGSTDQYWKLKNSYGPDWGENGYLYLDKSQGLNCLNICLDFAVATGLATDSYY